MQNYNSIEAFKDENVEKQILGGSSKVIKYLDKRAPFGSTIFYDSIYVKAFETINLEFEYK